MPSSHTRPSNELFTSKGIGVFRFSAALIEWSECELNDVKQLCVQAYKNAWHLPQSTTSAPFIFSKAHTGKEITLPMQLDSRLASVDTTGKMSQAAAIRSNRERKIRIERIGGSHIGKDSEQGFWQNLTRSKHFYCA